MKLVSNPKKTRTGQFSTGEEILTPLAQEHSIVANVLEYRGLAKLKSTYVDALPKQVAEDSKRIHTEYMQTVAATGRLSSTNPNLQDRKSTRLNSSHVAISYAVSCLKKK